MRCVAISCVKNESDIVEAFVRHALAHLDRLIVLDHGSSDGTREILQALVREGLPLEIVDDPSPGNHQWERMNRLMRDYALARHQADWIVPLDADEFLVGPPHVRFASDFDPESLPALAWKSYVPDPTDDPRLDNPVMRIRHRLLKEGTTTLKVVVHAALAKRPEVVLVQGNHGILIEGDVQKATLSPRWHLAHFPGRTPEQFALKVATKHLQYLFMTEKEPGWGWHYLSPIAKLRQGPGHFEAAFRDLILRYNLPPDFSGKLQVVHDPIPYAGGSLKYTPGPDPLRSMRALFECAEVFSQQRIDARPTPKYPANAEKPLVRGLREEVASLRQSWNFRVGRLVLTPARWGKRLLARCGILS